MGNVLDEVIRIGILPCLENEEKADVVEVATTLEKAGVPCLKLSSRNIHLIEQIHLQVPNVLVGIDQVADVDQAKQALACGASFIVRNGLTEEIADWVNQVEIPVLQENKMPGGIFCIPSSIVVAKQWSELASLLKKAVFKMLDFNLKHVGINSKDEMESNSTASKFENIFGLTKEDRGGAYFAGNVIEVMKKPFYGTHGHIAISTPFAGSAAYHLEQMGVKLNWQSAGYLENGNLRVVYLQDEIGGFAVHILQR